MSAPILFECSGECATRLAERSLEAQGLQVQRSFELIGAESDDCGCPYHGTPRCRCQYSVLLVYPPAGAPAVVTLHGKESRTRVDVAVDPNSPSDAELIERIRRTLTQASRRLCSPSPSALPETGPSLP